MIDTRQTAFLEEMGIGPLWASKNTAASEVQETQEQAVAADAAAEVAPVVSAPLQTSETGAAELLAEANTGAGIDLDIDLRTDARTDADGAVSTMSWTQLKAAVSGCEKCGLCKKRTNTVFGVGDEKAKWLFIGEGPGRNEDLQGEPFVGPAGKLLDNMVLALGLRRGDNAYIANIVKCRPTDPSGKDRPPTPEEAAACMPFLQRQIALIQPSVIVALGKTAAISLLQRDPETPVSSLRGKVHSYAGLPLIVTYHPAYLLRNLPDKRKSWSDLCMAMKAVHEFQQ